MCVLEGWVERTLVSWSCGTAVQTPVGVGVIKCEGCEEQTAINLPNTGHHHRLQRTEWGACVCVSASVCERERVPGLVSVVQECACVSFYGCLIGMQL